MSNNNIEMGSGSSKNEVRNNIIEELEEFDDNELSKKDKAFKNSILEIYNEIKEIKDKKSDRIFYRLPIQLCNYSVF